MKFVNFSNFHHIHRTLRSHRVKITIQPSFPNLITFNITAYNSIFRKSTLYKVFDSCPPFHSTVSVYVVSVAQCVIVCVTVACRNCAKFDTATESVTSQFRPKCLCLTVVTRHRTIQPYATYTQTCTQPPNSQTDPLTKAERDISNQESLYQIP